MSTAADEDLLDEYEDDVDDVDVDDDEGIYEDNEDIFDNEGQVDHRNPVITREQEQAQVYEIKTGREKPGGGAIAKRRQLVAQADKNGRWFVAVFEGKKQITKWKPPTKEQAQKLDKKGRIVRGGVLDDDAEDDEVDLGEDEAPKGGLLKKVLIGAGVLGALGLGGWFVYNKIKKDDDAEVDEVED